MSVMIRLICNEKDVRTLQILTHQDYRGKPLTRFHASSPSAPSVPRSIIARSHRLLALCALLLLVGCGGAIVVSDDYPVPVIDPLPYHAGIYISPEFRQYLHEDEEAKLKLGLGEQQTALFEQIFSAMFSQVTTLESLDQAGLNPQLDLVIEPALSEYAFLSPTETATSFYAVSLKYQIRLYSGSGELIGYWPFVAYGKNRKSFGSGKSALGEATTSAMRDAAAAMSSQFHDVVLKEQWRSPEELDGEI